MLVSLVLVQYKPSRAMLQIDGQDCFKEIRDVSMTHMGGSTLICIDIDLIFDIYFCKI